MAGVSLSLWVLISSNSLGPAVAVKCLTMDHPTLVLSTCGGNVPTDSTSLYYAPNVKTNVPQRGSSLVPLLAAGLHIVPHRTAGTQTGRTGGTSKSLVSGGLQ